MPCPECNHPHVNTRLWVENMPYYDEAAIGARKETIRVVIPVRECLFCGANWTDGAADIARSQAIGRQYRKRQMMEARR